MDGRSGGTDTELTMFTAGRVCHALLGRVDLVVTGHINPGFPELAHGEAVFHACFLNAAFRPQWIRPLARVPGSHAEPQAPDLGLGARGAGRVRLVVPPAGRRR